MAIAPLSVSMVILAGVGLGSPAIAQIVPDRTLGGEASRINRDVEVRGDRADRIDGGALRGSNLFHSFEQFNIGELERVYFSNPGGIENILSRVTGDDVSDILGTLGVDGNANLFFLNPNGVVFGENARLDIAGSFVVSTGDRFLFPDGSEFSATNPDGPPLLTVNLTPGIQYGRAAGNIRNDGVLYAGQDLSLHGHTLNLEGQLWAGGDLSLLADRTVRIRDSLEAPFIAAARGDLLVEGDRAVDIFALSHPDSGLWSGGDMTLRSATPVGGDAHFYSGGNFQIETLDQALGELVSPYDPVILSLGDVTFAAYQGNSLHILAAGDVTVSDYIQILGEADPFEQAIVDPTFQLSNGAPFPIDGFGEPTLDIRAGVDPDLLGFDQLPGSGDFFGTLVLTGPPVDSANIDIGTVILGTIAAGDILPGFLKGRVLLTNNYAPDLDNPVPGFIRINDTQTGDLDGQLDGIAIRANTLLGGGDVAIDSRNSIDIQGAIRAEAIPTNLEDILDIPGTIPIYEADGGSVTLIANDDITIQPNPQPDLPNYINSSGQRGGRIDLFSRAGDIQIKGPGTFALPAGIVSLSYGDAPGTQGADIVLTAAGGNILLDNDAFISSSTLGEVNAGNIIVRADGQVRLTHQSQIRGVVEIGGVGRGADITIQANSVVVDESQIGSVLFREIREDILDEAGNLLVAAGPGGRGEAGTINVFAEETVSLTGTTTEGFSSGIFSGTQRGTVGPAGDVTVVAGDRVSITNGAAISTLSFNPDAGGNVFVLAGAFEATAGGRVISVSREAGAAGRIDIAVSDRITIAGTDPNFAEREQKIENYQSNTVFGQEYDTLEEARNDIFGIRADEVNSLASSGLFVNASEDATPGNITLIGGTVAIADQAEILSTSSSNNLTSIGSIIIQATQDSVTINGGSQISTTNAGPGFAGSIIITAPRLISIVDSNPSDDLITRVESNGNFGRIALGQPIEEQLTDFSNIVTFSPEVIRVENALISTDNDPDPDAFNEIFGRAGDISFSAVNDIQILNTEVTSETLGDDRAGNIFFRSGNQLRIAGAASFIQSRTGLDTAGNAGTIRAVAQTIELTDDADLSTTTFGTGDAGLVTLDALDDVVISNDAIIFNTVADEAGSATDAAQGGTISITGRSLTLSNGGGLQAQVGDNAFGNAGSIFINMREAVTISGGRTLLFSDVGQGTVGNGGAIAVNSSTFSMTNGAQMQLQVGEGAIGNAGNVLIQSDRINMRGSTIFTRMDPGAVGQGGSIFIGRPVVNADGTVNVVRPVQSVTLTNGAQLQAQTGGLRDAVGNLSNAGNVLVVADSIRFDGFQISRDGTAILPTAAFTRVDPGGEGAGGTVVLSGRVRLDDQGTITDIRPAESVTITGGAQVRAETFGSIREASAGSVFVIADDITMAGVGGGESSGVLTRVESGSRGTGGFILVAGGFRQDDRGNITIDPANAITLTGGAQLQAQTAGQFRSSDAGNVLVAGDRIEFRGVGFPGRGEDPVSSGVVTRVERGSRGSGGDISLSGRIEFNARQNRTISHPADSIILRDGAQLQAQTAGTGPQATAGDVWVIADSILLDGLTGRISSGILTSVEPRSAGSGGSIFVGGGLVSDNDLFFDDDERPAEADAAESFSIRNGAQLVTQTSGQGDAGDVYVLSDRVTLDGFVNDLPSAIFSGVDGGTGRGGDISIAGSGQIFRGRLRTTTPAEVFSISEGAVLSVSSFGLRSIGRAGAVDPDRVAGNISVHARVMDMANGRVNVGLDNERGIFAETGEGNSGNINLNLERLLVLRGSTRISTTAGTLAAPGDGGNIAIATEDGGFVVAEPFGNNDITSNSFRGTGGRVEVTAQQILGLFFRSGDELRELLGTDDPSELDTENLPTSDVTAISQTDSALDGQVVFNVEAIDPSRGLTELPSNLVDGSQLVAETCPSGADTVDTLGEFIVTGRGGLPPNPGELLDSTEVRTHWIGSDATGGSSEPESQVPQSQFHPAPSTAEEPLPIVEAEGWRTDAAGRIVLVASTAAGAPSIPGTGSTGCPR